MKELGARILDHVIADPGCFACEVADRFELTHDAAYKRLGTLEQKGRIWSEMVTVKARNAVKLVRRRRYCPKGVEMPAYRDPVGMRPPPVDPWRKFCFGMTA